MSESTLPAGAHCRICGSANLNLAHYALEAPDRVDLYQTLSGGNSTNQLIRPCNCRGAFAYAHKVCLCEWIETTKHEFCDICRFQYNVDLHERTIFDWVSECQQACRILSVICTCALVYYVSALGVLNHLLSRRAPSNVLSVMVFASSCVWAVFCTVALIAFAVSLIAEFRSWRRTHRLVLVGENKSPLLESQPSPRDVLKSSGFRPK